MVLCTSRAPQWLAMFVCFLVIGCSFIDGAFVANTSPPRHKAARLTLAADAKGSTEENIKSGIRGSTYGAENNSTIPTAQECAAAVGVRPPLEAPSKTWKRAWNIQMKALPILHSLDKYKPPDSKLSLSCLWWKALAANDVTSPVYDDSLAYDLLPRGFRVLVGTKLRGLYPRLHHANVEIRTAYLDQSVTRIITQVHERQASGIKIRLVSLGAGYDVRSIKFRERGLVDQAVELDLPQVVEAKTKILNSPRLQRRRPNLTCDKFPQFYSVNLNKVDRVRSVLVEILQSSPNEAPWHTIFLFEGVMIYLDEGVPEALLKVCSDALKATGENGSLVFADRLENISGGDPDIGRRELAKNGWNVTDWLPKPGLARHMGCAEPI